ncbi:transcriptional regulator, partial [Salmonella enterica]|nr:transcriptional regulator [Salmonella enterica]EGQ6949328.1 transcriptional regulator [Salmonella enterica subsp. enterica]
MQWLFRLRCLTRLDSLEKIIERKKYELTDAELAVFWGAADHRLAELITGRLYDRVP